MPRACHRQHPWSSIPPAVRPAAFPKATGTGILNRKRRAQRAERETLCFLRFLLFKKSFWSAKTMSRECCQGNGKKHLHENSPDNHSPDFLLVLLAARSRLTRIPFAPQSADITPFLGDFLPRITRIARMGTASSVLSVVLFFMT
jgi:hypothetical protein